MLFVLVFSFVFLKRLQGPQHKALLLKYDISAAQNGATSRCVLHFSETVNNPLLTAQTVNRGTSYFTLDDEWGDERLWTYDNFESLLADCVAVWKGHFMTDKDNQLAVAV